jgi:hypothetical protein
VIKTRTPVPPRLRQQIDHWAAAWLKRFDTAVRWQIEHPGPLNYPTAVFSEWRGRSFYLNTRYRRRRRKPDQDFVVRCTRMTLTSPGRFDLAYFRHTDRWFTTDRGLTAAQCFREIDANEVFWPMT